MPDFLNNASSVRMPYLTAIPASCWATIGAVLLVTTKTRLGFLSMSDDSAGGVPVVSCGFGNTPLDALLTLQGVRATNEAQCPTLFEGLDPFPRTSVAAGSSPQTKWSHSTTASGRVVLARPFRFLRRNQRSWYAEVEVSSQLLQLRKR